MLLDSLNFVRNLHLRIAIVSSAGGQLNISKQFLSFNDVDCFAAFKRNLLHESFVSDVDPNL